MSIWPFGKSEEELGEYKAVPNSCYCNPRFCDCNPWIVLDPNGSRGLTFHTQESAEKHAGLKNKELNR